MSRNLKRAAAVLGILALGLASCAFGATVIQTNLTDTIGTFRTNVNTSLANLNYAIVSTTTPLGTIASLSTTTGNLIVGSTATGWNVLALGANGYCPQASSGAALGIAWAVCGGSINGVISQAYGITASGTGLSIIQNGATTTIQLNPATFLQPGNNLSEIVNATSARSNLGLASYVSQTVVPVANGGSGTSTAPTDSQFLSANGSVPTWKNLVAGNNVTLATTTTSTVITVTTGSASAGTDGMVQYNASGTFAATSTFRLTSSTGQLNIPGVLVTGGATPTVIAGATSSNFSYQGFIGAFQVNSGVTSIVINAQGAAGYCAYANSTAGYGGSATGTLSVSSGSIYYFAIGGEPNKNIGGFPGGGQGSDPTTGCGGGGFTWVGTSPTFSTSTMIIAAGGGGGQNNGVVGIKAGDGGGLTGSAGQNDTGTGLTQAGGGTQTAGGVAGNNAIAGAMGLGGNAAATTTNSASSGGGGGCFGGGGGAGLNVSHGSGTGGGGSTCFSSSLTSTSTTAGIQTTTGTLKITGGVTIIGAFITGNNTAGKISALSSFASSTITFAGTGFANAPNGTSCAFMPNSAVNYPYVVAGTSTVTVTWQNAIAAGQSFNYQCLGY